MLQTLTCTYKTFFWQSFLLVLRSTYTQQKFQDENTVGRYEMLETYVKKWFLSGFFSSVQICSPWGIFFWDWGRFSKDSRLVHNVPFRRQHEILWRYFECTCLLKWRKNFGNETLQKKCKKRCLVGSQFLCKSFSGWLELTSN